MQDKILAYLRLHGASSSESIQSELHISQPTASRHLNALSDEIVALGRGRSIKYAIAEPIGNSAAQQPIWQISEEGERVQLGVLSFLEKSQIHIQAHEANELYISTPQNPLPWYLSSLRAQGFIGRIMAKSLESKGVGANPETWDVNSILIAAINTKDAPGNLLLGELHPPETHSHIPLIEPGLFLDDFSINIAKTLPVGSSAGGEQPKFPAINAHGKHVLVKFSPPRGTPFGDRWSDLLCAEALSYEVLLRHGFKAAPTEIIQTEARTYLLSERFDRVGTHGRQHVVSMGAIHAAFVSGAYENWAVTCDALVSQKRLSAADAVQCRQILQFGRLIGNTDMHSGNASLYARGTTLKDVLKGRFQLTPVYDMLPMRWRPDPMVGTFDYELFDVEVSQADAVARVAARDFWMSLSAHALVSQALREIACAMACRIGVIERPVPAD